jgi:succinyl-CoA synthetase alpha subunit
MDSIFLMQATKAVSKLEGVKEAVVVMGTEINKTVLADVGRLTGEAKAAGPADIIVSLELSDEKAVDAVMKYLNELNANAGKSSPAGNVTYPTLGLAKKAIPQANLAVISVPGEFAALEAKKALSNDMNVFIFSDNVSLEDEIELKKSAEEKDLFVMGPGCGNSVINNISLGLMSVVAKGRVGIVGASGSGIHEISALITQKGLGISQAVGVGGRDLSEKIGGSTMIRAFKFLEHDKNTDVIVLVSKPPFPATAEKIYAQVKSCKKPVVIYFLGGDPAQIQNAGAYAPDSLEQAAAMAVSLAKGEKVHAGSLIAECIEKLTPKAQVEKARLSPAQKYLRGLFCGGTHNEEAILIIKKMLGELHANVQFGGVVFLDNPRQSIGNSVVDMGDEEFTKGKPHPVMDPSILNDRIIREGSDPEVGVILFDLLLGYGAHENPVGQIEEAIQEINKQAQRENRYISLVASITGTSLDPQGFENQKKRLESLGVTVLVSNAQAAILAGLIVK